MKVVTFENNTVYTGKHGSSFCIAVSGELTGLQKRSLFYKVSAIVSAFQPVTEEQHPEEQDARSKP